MTRADADAQADRRGQRRSARRAQSRIEILDAAEKVFGEDGVRDGSVRKIAVESGFSAAAIYLFFENKQHLLSQTLTRRGDELNEILHNEAASELAPIEKLHRIADVTKVFFAERPHFRLLLRHINGGAMITGPVLAEFVGEVHARYLEAMLTLAGIVRAGQEAGEIRDGNELAVAHLYSVLVNEFVLLDASLGDTEVGTLTSAQFHAFVDGALRNPSSESGPALPRGGP